MAVTTLQNSDFFTLLKERHSVRRYEPGVSMPESDLREILEAAALAPSAWNLQH